MYDVSVIPLLFALIDRISELEKLISERDTDDGILQSALDHKGK